MTKRIQILQRSFAGGKLSDDMYGRIDLTKYPISLSECENFFGAPHGPMRNRAGFQFIAEVNDSTEAARLMSDTSRDDSDVRGEAIMATVQTDIWSTLLELREADNIADPMDRLKALTKAATSVGELSRARVNQAKWRAEVDAKVQDAADKVTKLARTGGLDEKTAAEIRASILGITQRQQHSAVKRP
jgi:hypothetical protein